MYRSRSLRTRRHRRISVSVRLGVVLVAVLVGAVGVVAVAGALGTTVLLFDNDFDTPDQPFSMACAPQLDSSGINTLYGSSASFQQRFTVEAVLVTDAVFSDPSGTGGTAAIGMLSVVQDDVLAITLDTQGRSFLNLTFDLAAIDVPSCGGPLMVAGPPQLQVSVVDSGSTYVLGAGPGIPGTVLDSETVTGSEPTPTTQYTLEWTSHAVALDVSGSTDDFVSLIFDGLKPSGQFADYMVFDNLRIGASNEENSVPVTLMSFSVGD